jgi:hypothetical protein
MNYKIWDSAAEYVVSSMEEDAKSQMPDPKDFAAHETFLSRWVLKLQEGEYDKDDIELVVDVLRSAGVQSLQQMTSVGIPYNHNDMVELLCRKQHDYGHQNINNFGILGLAVRMCDKIARIKNLVSRGSHGVNEPLEDSYRDIVGYATIAVMYHEGTFQYKLEKDI